jgi:hypothetical protein
MLLGPSQLHFQTFMHTLASLRSNARGFVDDAGNGLGGNPSGSGYIPDCNYMGMWYHYVSANGSANIMIKRGFVNLR